MSEAALRPLERLDGLLEPRSVAIVGASGDPTRIGGRPIELLRRWGFPGDVVAVNPKYDEVGGVPCVAQVSDLETAPDVAYVVLPARAVPDAVRACAERGVAYVVVSTGGFSETGEEGARWEQEVRDVVRDSPMRLLGPNCEGIWNVHGRFPLTFGSAAFRDDVKPGPIAIVSQSGSVGAGVAQGCLNRGIGCGYLITTGNEADLTVSDAIEDLARRDEVGGIACFIEGIRDPDRFLAACAAARRAGTPIAVLRSGRSDAAVAAMQSHTGRMVGPDRIYDALFRQAGVRRAGSIGDLLDFAEGVSRFGGERPGGLAVVSLSGGACALILDECDARGIERATFSERTTGRLAERLPDYATVENPVDLAGVTLNDPPALVDSLEIVLEDPATGAVLVQLANRGARDAHELGEAFADAARRHEKPVALSFIGGMPAEGVVGELHGLGIACFDDPARAVSSMSAFAAPAEGARAEEATSAPAAPASGEDAGSASWAEGAAVLADAKIRTPTTVKATSAAAVAEAVSAIGPPVVLKLDSSAVLHRSDVDAVFVGVQSSDEAVEIYRRLEERWGDGCPVIVQELIAGGAEALVAVRREPDLGVVVTIGSGGVEAELLDDLCSAVAPVEEEYLLGALRETRLGVRLAGYRGRPGHDVAALVAAAASLHGVVSASPAIVEVEINPLMVFEKGKGTCAVDVALRWATTEDRDER